MPKMFRNLHFKMNLSLEKILILLILGFAVVSLISRIYLIVQPVFLK